MIGKNGGRQMLLIVGGSASGKRSYVLGHGWSESDIADATLGDDRPVLDNLQALVDANLTDLEQSEPDLTIKQIINDYALRLLAQIETKRVVICDEQGCGVIPNTPHERRVREVTGRLCIELARQATEVVRMVCGVPQVIKGPGIEPTPLPAFERPDASHTMSVTMLRHSITTDNEQRLYSGSRSNCALSAKGRELAESRGADPSVGLVYVTPMLRTAQTASILFPKAMQVVVPGLTEMDFGDFEGRSADQMEHDAAYRAWVDSMCEDACPNGESRATFVERTNQAFAELVASAIDNDETSLTIVAHGGTLMALLSSYALPHRSYWDWSAKPCHGYRFVIDPIAWEVNPAITDVQPI